MGHGTHLLQSTIDAFTRFQRGLVFRFPTGLVHYAIYGHFGRGQILAQAIVKLARNSASFLILHAHETAGKLAQRLS